MSCLVRFWVLCPVPVGFPGAGILSHRGPCGVGRDERWLPMEMAPASKYFLGWKVGFLSKKKQEEEFAAWVWICNASTTWSLRHVWSISELASLLFRRRVYVQEQKGVDPNLNLKGLRQHMLAISRMRLLSASASAKVWPWFVECLNSWASAKVVVQLWAHDRFETSLWHLMTLFKASRARG